MSRLTAQRARLARVRRIQHNLAATAAGRAAAEVARLQASEARLADLRAGLVAGQGLCDGAALASLGELGGRLDAARDALGRTIVNARGIARQREDRRIAARRDQESAERLEQRAIATAEALAERKAQARVRLRARRTIGDIA